MTSYRTGNKNARNIYRVDGDGTEEHIGCMFTEEAGAHAVAALNAHGGQADEVRAEVNRLRAALDRITAYLHPVVGGDWTCGPDPVVLAQVAAHLIRILAVTP